MGHLQQWELEGQATVAVAVWWWLWPLLWLCGCVAVWWLLWLWMLKRGQKSIQQLSFPYYIGIGNCIGWLTIALWPLAGFDVFVLPSPLPTLDCSHHPIPRLPLQLQQHRINRLHFHNLLLCSCLCIIGKNRIGWIGRPMFIYISKAGKTLFSESWGGARIVCVFIYISMFGPSVSILTYIPFFSYYTFA